MKTSLRVGQHVASLKLIKRPPVVQIETRRCVALLVEMKVHYHFCHMTLGQFYKRWDAAQLLLSPPLVYGVWHM